MRESDSWASASKMASNASRRSRRDLQRQYRHRMRRDPRGDGNALITGRFQTCSIPREALSAEAVSHIVALMSISERFARTAHFECVEEQTEGCRNVNCCIAGFMSRCGAGPSIIDQHACKFFRKSSAGERCMHYCVSIDGHCDCVPAQVEMKRSAQSGS